jgi:hypothetical protein
MAKLTYSEQLRHPNWQRKRLEVMEAAGFQCEECGADDVTLNVHHRRYVKGRMVWEYEGRDLACLCEDCHAEEHVHRELLDLLLVAGGRAAVRDAIGLLGGWLDGDLMIDDPELSESARFIGGPLFDYGVFATVLHQRPECLVQAVKAIGPTRLNPAQEQAVARWDALVASWGGNKQA